MWKQIDEYPNYEVSTEGQVRNIKKQNLLKNLKKNYFQVKLNGKFQCVHRLVAVTFIPRFDMSLIVDHIDRDKYNNNMTNLRWVSYSQNSLNRDYYVHNKDNTLHHIQITSQHFYQVKIMKNGRYIYNKTFKTKQEAILNREEFMANNPK